MLGTSCLWGECATNWATLPKEKLRTNNDNIYLICCSTMYVSLTYPFNIVQHTLSHIVEQCKSESLTSPDNIVWSTVTSCWANNVCQFDRSLKVQLHDAIYRLRFCSNSLIHILSLSSSHSDVALIQKNRGDKSHRVIVALLFLLWVAYLKWQNKKESTLHNTHILFL